MIYLQNYFTVNAEDLLKVAKGIPEYSAAFTLNAYTGEAKKPLKDLARVNLEELKQS